ncbi:MAG: carbon-nitrogen hydrolase family protein [Patescibacteria group bacterium]
MRTVSVACIQMRSSDVIEDNIEDATRRIREAATQGAELVVTPEMTALLDRRPGALLSTATTEKEELTIANFRELARELSINLIIGSHPMKVTDDRCANRSFFIGKNGEILARYDKIHLFDADFGGTDVYKESDRFVPGEAAQLISVGDLCVGMTICYDLRFPNLFRSFAKAGANVIVVPASFTRPTGEAHWHVLLRARAIESGCFILAPAQGGIHADGRETFGHSLIVDPWGKILVEAGTEPEVIVANLDLNLVSEARRKLPTLLHDREYTLQKTNASVIPGAV